MNPYNHNPFKTDTTRETRNEFDANRALAKSADRKEAESQDPWNEFGNGWTLVEED